MSLLAWSNTFSVGVKDIDDQHKKLIELANQLNDAMKAGRGKEVLEKTLSELVAYTEYHFAFEERLMATHGYPNEAAHLNDHKGLVKTVGEFRSRFENGDGALTNEVMGLLRDWLSRHIMNSDRALARDLNLKGIK